MQEHESASGMILQQSKRNVSKIIDSVHKNDSLINISYQKNYFQMENNKLHEDLNFDDKQLQLTEESHIDENKENTSVHNDQKSLAMDTTGQQFKKVNRANVLKSKIKVRNSHRESKVQKKSEKILCNILQPPQPRQAYIKRLVQILPQGNVCTSRILRQKQFFRTQISLMAKKDEMMRFNKIDGCLTPSYQIISSNKMVNILGYMKSDIFGSIFNIYERLNQNQNKLLATICYEQQFSFKIMPRKVQLYVLKEGVDLPVNNDFLNLKDAYEQLNCEKIIKLSNRQPQINQSGISFLDFESSYILSSNKNVIMEEQVTGKPLLMLYKVQSNEFQIKVRQKMSVFIGYCFALSSLIFKLACQ